MYQAIHAIRHDGKDYEAGEKINLTEKEAEKLIGWVEKISESKNKSEAESGKNTTSNQNTDKKK